MERSIIPIQKMEIAARNIDKSLAMDSSAPRLIDLMNVNPQTGSTVSGMTDHDYPTLSGLPLALSNLTEIKTISNVPLPTEIVDHFNHVQCHCMMGLFPEISRAWLTVDSDIYIWTYEQNTDLAYFDGINETILCVGLVKPKPGVFHAFIKYLLVLTTAVDIIVLGVTFTSGASGEESEIQLIPDPVFSLPTDGSTVSVIQGTSTGRLFYGTKEGSLFEISYQAESGWFGKRCKKTNLSTSTLSFLMPSFLNAALSEEDGIIQIAIDNTRHILYTLTEKGSIEVCDLGEKGNSFSRITKVSQSSLVNQAMCTVKTLESQNFRPIVSISAIEASESNNLNLVAITQTGVRFYFSVVSLSNQQPNQRPYTLTLVHVRLPPGYSANITVRPRAVHLAHYRDRNFLLVSNVKEKDVLWCMSSDLFPFSQNLMEAYTTVNLDGPALAIAEVQHDLPLLGHHQQFESLPLIVRQHFEAPKKFVVLTSHSIQIFLKQRPVDVLKQIIKDSHGRDTDALKAFFAVQKEDQACATSLILASLESEDNAEVADLATRAFFMFGGEPKISTLNQSNMCTSMFSPNIISTPAPNQSLYSSAAQGFPPQAQGFSQSMCPQSTFDLTSPFVFSSKHNGLYLYLGRILRPLWNRRCVETVSVDSKNYVYQSTITSTECIYILNNLTALHNFLSLNTQLNGSLSASAMQSSMFNNTSMNMTRLNATVQDAQLEERQSLDALKTFVCHCCQIIGLWKVLCEHQFHTLVGQLPENQQQILQNTTFKELFLYRAEICSYLISTLVNSYLGDNASVDSISKKLMEVCPLLYKSEDAAFSKANEILKAVRTVQNIDEKEEMLASALQLCKSVAPNINLPEVCKQFTALKAYKAVIELCAHHAKSVDPDKIAENFSSNLDNAGDQEGFSYYQRRMQIYQEILNMLETVYNEQTVEETGTQRYELNFSDNKSILFDGTDNSRMNSVLRHLIDEILDYNDEILHIALYEWMMSKQMTGDLIRIEKPSLEQYLKRASITSQENTAVMDLMWKFYESHNNHAAAAKILNNLASKPGLNVTLKERLAYLARAIMCMRSDKVGYAPFMGVFLRDLEDKMEVAKVQELILDTISNLRNEISNANEAIAALNSGLYEISQLYENFAEPFNLLECQLAIIQCAGYADDVLTETIWKQILSEELRKTSGSGSERMAQILTKVKYLARQFAQSNNCFPLNYIVYELELLNAKLKGDRSLIPNMLVAVADISFEKLIEVYNGLVGILVNDPFWQMEENEFHMPESIGVLINNFLNKHDQFSSVEKRKITSVCQDTVAAILSYLYSKPNSDHIVDRLRGIQAKLSRI